MTLDQIILLLLKISLLSGVALLALALLRNSSNLSPSSSAGAISLIRTPQILRRPRHLRNYYPEHAPLPAVGASATACVMLALLFLLAAVSTEAKTVVASDSLVSQSGISAEQQEAMSKALERARSFLANKQTESGTFGAKRHDASTGLSALVGAVFIDSKDPKYQQVHARVLELSPVA